MSKTRSKALYQFLSDSGVLNGTPEAISMAKREYRKQYKQQWKQQKRPRKEIRFYLTLKEHQRIRTHALMIGMKPTTLCKRAALASVEQAVIIPQEDVLLEVLQLIGLALNNLYNTNQLDIAIKYIEQAEQGLFQYLDIYNDTNEPVNGLARKRGT